MAESSRKHKGSSTSAAATRTPRPRATGASPTPIPPSLSSSTLFSSDEQHIRYSNLFQSHPILDPKYLDLEFFDGEAFDCYQVFQTTSMIPFMSLKLPYYPELVRVFYSNLQIQGGTLISEVHGCYANPNHLFPRHPFHIATHQHLFLQDLSPSFPHTRLISYFNFLLLFS